MARFTEVGELKVLSNKPFVKDRFVQYEWHEVPIQVECAGQSWRYDSRKGVLLAKDDACLLPYFKGRDGRYKVVLTEQYRIAVRSASIESAGGIIDESLDAETPRTFEQALATMVKELEEELGIALVDTGGIKLVFKEWLSASTINALFWGGIVEIDESMLPKEAVHEKWKLKEYTILLAVHDFIELLIKRDEAVIKVDLMTSRLLDELAKHLGLLEKKY